MYSTVALRAAPHPEVDRMLRNGIIPSRATYFPWAKVVTQCQLLLLLPCLPFLTGQLPMQSLGLAKVQSSFAAGEKDLLLWKPGRELLVTSTACSVPITSEVDRVGCQHSSFILTTPVASPAVRNSRWLQTPEGPGSKLASFCLITQAVTSQQTKHG